MRKPEKPVMMMSHNRELSRVLAEQYWIDYGQFLYKKHRIERGIKITNYIGATILILLGLVAIFGN